MPLQKKLYRSYRTEIFLSDRLLTSFNNPSIQSTLKDRIPRTSHHAVNLVANQLCDKPNFAGSTSACPIEDAGAEVDAENILSGKHPFVMPVIPRYRQIIHGKRVTNLKSHTPG